MPYTLPAVYLDISSAEAQLGQVHATFNSCPNISIKVCAGGAAAEAGRPRRGSTSSATAAGGETSNRHYGRRWEKRRAGKRADADTCRSLSCFPWKSATKR